MGRALSGIRVHHGRAMTTPEVRAEALAIMRGERPFEDESMDRYRAEYLFSRRRVTGGRAAHAFFGDEKLPACGEWFGRGPEEARQDPVWHQASARMHLHHVCARVVARRRAAYLSRGGS